MKHLFLVLLLALPISIWANKPTTKTMVTLKVEPIKVVAITMIKPNTVCTSRNTITLVTTQPASYYAKAHPFQKTGSQRSLLGTPANKSGQEPQKLKIRIREDRNLFRRSTPYGYYPVN